MTQNTPPTTPDAPAIAPPTDDFDALADLFLGEFERDTPLRITPDETVEPDPTPPPPGAADAAPEATAVPEAGAAVAFEAVVLGHLPVRVGPWVAQYAAHVAEASGRPVALLRARSGQVSIELHGAELGDVATADDLDGALELAAARAVRWIVQCDDLDEPALVSAPGIDSVTVLSAGNEAAVVDAYRTIKALLAPGGPLGATGADEDAEGAPPVRVGVMGADAARAADVARKLREASATFLANPIDLAACVTRMGPTGARPLFRGPSDLGVDDIVGRAQAAAARRESEPGDREPGAEPSPVFAPEPVILESPEREPEPVPAPSAADAADEPGAPAIDAPPDDDGPDLVALLPGLTALDIEWPDGPEVRFARDSSGNVHALLAGPPDGALASLTGAAAWATRHAALLARAFPGEPAARFDEPATMHLFTPDAASVRPLADADVRVRLLAPVDPAARWFTTELN